MLIICTLVTLAQVARVSVLVPQKPIEGTLQTRMSQGILTKIGGDRETDGMSKDQPAFLREIIILKVILDSVHLPNLAQAGAGGYQEPTQGFYSVSNREV